MEICIFGAGSLGSALGGMLSEKNEVVLIGRRKNMAAIRKAGLRLVGDLHKTVHLEAREEASGIDPPDLLIITTKSYDTKEAIRSCRSLVDDRTLVLTLQNGLGNLDLIRTWRRRRAFGATTTIGANLESPGVVRLSGLGVTIIGSDLDPDGAAIIADAFRSSGVPTKVTRDIVHAIWSKAIINACINPTAAVLRVPNGKLLESPAISRLMKAVCAECECVANATGQVRIPSSLYPRVRAVCRDTSENLSSMLQDVLHQKRTEIAQINGAFCEAGDKLGLATPLNDALVAMILSLDDLRGMEKG